MTAQEYLSQAYMIEQQIRSKQAQIESLRALASCITPRPTDQEPVSHTRNVHSMEDTVLKIIEANRELAVQIDALVDKKIEISRIISRVENVEFRLVLEKRYLTFCTWEEIAADLHYSVRTAQRMHGRAMEEVQEMMDGELIKGWALINNK